AISHDELVKSFEVGNPDLETVDHIMKGISEEVAALKFDRREAERKGEKTVQISSKRIKGLKDLGDMLLKKYDYLQKTTIDLSSPQFGKLFTYILETFKRSMLEENISETEVEQVFSRLRKHVDDEGWKSEAQSRMKG
ncbi:MAG: hypothetical protein AAGM67_00935, partial [Bacteroidota bacterium]